ncbi:hypothetical protein BS47DRAFT_1173794 [Hydnum rufescens UP504]|uniref:Uncharacterized protein n=1 Tax=Hydnum rufescens UP504 TaxID=1448309 RepID=A0A9P6ATK4_9AGAM|nr:hypothetical protein BS47DRAFT_1173794 [Hydnum rufescens UP504]
MHPLILLQRAAARKAQNTERSTSVTMDGLDNTCSPLPGLPLSSQLTVAQEDAPYDQSPPQTSSSFSSSSSSLSFSAFHLDASDSRTSSPPTPHSPYLGMKETSSLPFPDFSFEGRLQVPETAFRFIPPNLNSNDEGNHALSVDDNPYAALGFIPFPQYPQDPTLPVFLDASGFPSIFTLTDPRREDAEPPRKKHCTGSAIHDVLDQINRSPCSRCGKSEVNSLDVFCGVLIDATMHSP